MATVISLDTLSDLAVMAMDGDLYTLGPEYLAPGTTGWDCDFFLEEISEFQFGLYACMAGEMNPDNMAAMLGYIPVGPIMAQNLWTAHVQLFDIVKDWLKAKHSSDEADNLALARRLAKFDQTWKIEMPEDLREDCYTLGDIFLALEGILKVCRGCARGCAPHLPVLEHISDRWPDYNLDEEYDDCPN